jgi:hypothetical protein
MAFLNAEIMRSEVRKLAQGGTQIYINFGSVLSINFFFLALKNKPKSLTSCLPLTKKLMSLQSN